MSSRDIHIRTSYRQIHVLMITWAECDVPLDWEQRQLRDVLETDYYANVYQYIIPLGSTSAELESKLAAEVLSMTSSHGQDSNNLLILQYHGHGGPGPNFLSWNRTIQDESDIIQWYRIQRAMQSHCKADILFVFDCCGGGAPIFSRADRSRLRGLAGPAPEFEILAACGKESETLGGVKRGANTFTWKVAAKLRNLVHDKPNTDAIISALLNDDSSKVSPFRTSLTCVRPIVLEPCYSALHEEAARLLQCQGFGTENLLGDDCLVGIVRHTRHHFALTERDLQPLRAPKSATIEYVIAKYAWLVDGPTSRISLKYRGSFPRPGSLLAEILSTDSGIIVFEAFVDMKRYYKAYNQCDRLHYPPESEPESDAMDLS